MPRENLGLYPRSCTYLFRHVDASGQQVDVVVTALHENGGGPWRHGLVLVIHDDDFALDVAERSKFFGFELKSARQTGRGEVVGGEEVT